ncbi:unnamed protein product [Effrenium voratum]|nr:unnamed protein product [Effrenium voratum]
MKLSYWLCLLLWPSASLGFKHGSLGEDTKGPGKEKPDPSGKAKKTANATNGGHGHQAHGANGALALARQQDANGSQYLPANRSNITEGEFPVVEELTVALPLFLVNVTNATGLIAARNNAPDPNITYRAGNFENDMSFLEDKMAGFYGVLESAMGEDFHRYCPYNNPLNTQRCLMIAMCLIQAQVPEVIGMQTYTMLVEQIERFEDTLWPVLREVLESEDKQIELGEDEPLPEKYNCDRIHRPETDLVQISSDSQMRAGSAAMSAALMSAADASHQLLDAHKLNSSMDVTIQKLHQVWRPVCSVLDCDPSNYWDIFLRHHHHTAMLQEHSRDPRAVRSDIRTRLKLQNKVQRFISKHHADVSFVQSFARFGQEQSGSVDIFHTYNERNRKALLQFAKTTLRSLPEDRAVRLVDRIELSKVLQKNATKLSMEEEEEMRDMDEDQTDTDDEQDEDEVEQTEQAAPEPHARSTALLYEGHQLVESMDEGEGWGRRRRRRRRRSRRRRRRSRRRRRRWWKKVVEAVVDVVVAVVEVVVALLECFGSTSRLVNTGYTRCHDESGCPRYNNSSTILQREL